MQLLIVYIILALSVAYSVYAIIKYIRKKNNPCDGCDGCEIKNQLTKNSKHKVSKNPNTCVYNPSNIS
ncbi:MAG: FeoB-associated Cys-rich membrane protein [Paludibacteraceae bacterium]|nr:FeoB-associated Cys-rich membrane protein [Paludibacteraceae bacterium]MBN2788486.1 FeoB-associated Cys-rich membrane protein [Paludibacteraceae bacterium]